MALGGESERLDELKVQQLRSKRKRMEGSTDETVGDIWSRSLKRWLEAKIQAAVTRPPEPTSLVHLDHHHASSSRKRAVRVWRIGGVGVPFILLHPLHVRAQTPRPVVLNPAPPPAMAQLRQLLVRRRLLDCKTARVLCAQQRCGLLTADCGEICTFLY